MNTTVGDVLLAGILKDPQGAGRMIAEAITHAEAPIAAAMGPEGKAEPNSETKADPKENGQISPSTTVRAARTDGSRPNLASVLQGGPKNTSIHVSTGVIGEIPVDLAQCRA